MIRDYLARSKLSAFWPAEAGTPNLTDAFNRTRIKSCEGLLDVLRPASIRAREEQLVRAAENSWQAPLQAPKRGFPSMPVLVPVSMLQKQKSPRSRMSRPTRECPRSSEVRL